MTSCSRDSEGRSACVVRIAVRRAQRCVRACVRDPLCAAPDPLRDCWHRATGGAPSLWVFLAALGFLSALISYLIDAFVDKARRFWRPAAAPCSCGTQMWNARLSAADASQSGFGNYLAWCAGPGRPNSGGRSSRWLRRRVITSMVFAALAGAVVWCLSMQAEVIQASVCGLRCPAQRVVTGRRRSRPMRRARAFRR
jgi:hypothetical protein